MNAEPHPSQGTTIVLIHGLWLTPLSWEGWKERFEGLGHSVLAPAWPGMDRTVEEIRHDPSPLDHLGVREITDHYAEIVRGLDRPPIIIGHSFGGLFTELLLDRGLGAAGVAISPAPIKGILRLPPAQLRASLPVLGNPANRRRTVELTPSQFHYAFTNTMDAAEASAAYERDQVPGPGRPLFQAAFANVNPRAATKIDLANAGRPPLLVMGNAADHTVPAAVSKEAAKRLRRSGATAEYKEYAGRPHFTAGAPGWESVADDALRWATAHVST